MIPKRISANPASQEAYRVPKIGRPNLHHQPSLTSKGLTSSFSHFLKHQEPKSE
jgi:hypothetical protein